jgi:excisionase family DNA binding protein
MKSNADNDLLKVKNSESMNHHFWNIEDLSNYLNVKVKTIYSMVPDIPHYRIGKLIRFKKDEIDSWLESKRKNVHQTIQNKKARESTNNQIDLLIRKTIDRAKQEDYNSHHGKSDRIKTQEKEMNYGSI